MKVHVLGSGAGGGFPQWNCNCDNCARFRRGDMRAQARTQSSIAVSGDGIDWVLINASPDVRAQVDAFPSLQPGRSLRDTGIRAVMLMDSQIDHTTGLLTLREGDPLELYCTEMVHQDLTSGFPVLTMLGHYCGVNWHPVPIDGSGFEVEGVAGLRFESLALSSKAPPYSPHRHDPHPGDNIGLVIEDTVTGARLFYAPGLGALDDEVMALMSGCACVLVDGTFWTEDEMERRGVGTKRAADMGHLPQSGPGGMIERLKEIDHIRRVLIHINNTNPILDEDGPERAELLRERLEIAHDGLELVV